MNNHTAPFKHHYCLMPAGFLKYTRWFLFFMFFMFIMSLSYPFFHQAWPISYTSIVERGDLPLTHPFPQASKPISRPPVSVGVGTSIMALYSVSSHSSTPARTAGIRSTSNIITCPCLRLKSRRYSRLQITTPLVQHLLVSLNSRIKHQRADGRLRCERRIVASTLGGNEWVQDFAERVEFLVVDVVVVLRWGLRKYWRGWIGVVGCEGGVCC